MRVLLVEDDPQVARQVTTTLERAGYVVEQADDGEEAWFLGDTEDYDAVILDLGLPTLDGITVLTRWRDAGRDVPVLILTARDTWREKVQGLRAGADDYLAKPFEFEELLARIEALIRRATGNASPLIEIDGVSLEPSSGRVVHDGQLVELTGLEYKALSYLMHKRNKTVSKTELTEHIYDRDSDRDSNVIEVLINRLRKKLGAKFILTRRGRGYEINED